MQALLVQCRSGTPPQPGRRYLGKPDSSAALNQKAAGSELLRKMGQESFDEFYLREYPKVVGLLQGLLRGRLVAEELAQETFLVAYRDWARVGGLDNPRAWVRKVALNQRGSFLRAYVRQQARERSSVVEYEDDIIKLADDHAEVWAAIRTLPPSQAQVIALHYYEDYSIDQIAAALGRAPGTIKAQLHHGRRKLARLLGTGPDGRST
jgi:RNA polymerase sigma-70 factor (ECF subfamily)